MGSYRIGTVCRLTGVPPETLRSWEARYGLVTPGRTPGGFRLYSEQDLERIRLVRALTLSGHAVGTLVDLGLDELRRRSGVDPAAAVTEAIRLVDAALHRLESHVDSPGATKGAVEAGSVVARLRAGREHLQGARRALD